MDHHFGLTSIVSIHFLFMISCNVSYGLNGSKTGRETIFLFSNIECIWI